jgi:hypothetical protein
MTIIDLIGNKRINTISDITTYTLSADKSYSMAISGNVSVSVEVVWASLDAADATAVLQQSTFGDKPQTHPTASTITLSGTSGTDGWQTDLWNAGYLHVALTANSNTSGTVRILVTIKEN